MTTQRTYIAVSLFVLLAALPRLLQFTGQEYLLSLATRALIYGLAASRLNRDWLPWSVMRSGRG